MAGPTSPASQDGRDGEPQAHGGPALAAEDTEPGASEAPLPPTHGATGRLNSAEMPLLQPEATSSPPECGSDVWLHIYHCDPCTGCLNRILLKRAEIGIYHAGIEVYGEEWSFQYFEDTWDDPAVSGLIRCLPKQMPDYEYQESVNLGPTTLSQEDVDRVLLSLHHEWPACSYHLTHNNCLTFAERFARELQAPAAFPVRLKGILEASRQNSCVDAIVDYSWSWVKWWMIRKHRQPSDRRELLPQE
mmetsp:Transcript_3627/g.9920  ORF Transcript_3627/g.9920 Transcript_3627/m.9920 type:complete len:246 (-) Transcript_3627:332-1069(-)